MTKTNSIPTVTLKLESDGMIGAESMIIALHKSGCPLETMKLYQDLTDADKVVINAKMGI